MLGGVRCPIKGVRFKTFRGQQKDQGSKRDTGVKRDMPQPEGPVGTAACCQLKRTQVAVSAQRRSNTSIASAQAARYETTICLTHGNPNKPRSKGKCECRDRKNVLCFTNMEMPAASKRAAAEGTPDREARNRSKQKPSEPVGVLAMAMQRHVLTHMASSQVERSAASIGTLRTMMREELHELERSMSSRFDASLYGVECRADG